MSRQQKILTASGLYKKISFAASFGSNDNHIQSLCLHACVFFKIHRGLSGENGIERMPLATFGMRAKGSSAQV
jgi:hypothetical protein